MVRFLIIVNSAEQLVAPSRVLNWASGLRK